MKEETRPGALILAVDCKRLVWITRMPSKTWVMRLAAVFFIKIIHGGCQVNGPKVAEFLDR